ncbi:MAG TPA: cbb3-type cytochrome c oxidase subunit I [Gemmatimonadaceae bacterium]
MHTLVRRYIKTAIAFLIVGLLIGGWMIVRRELFGLYPRPYVISAHTHALFVGFIMMMILGVALWLFPRPEKTDERYSPTAANAAYWLLTVGTGARVAGELLRVASAAIALRVIIVLAGFAQIVGILVFFYTIWTRIRPVGSKVREAKGERF